MGHAQNKKHFLFGRNNKSRSSDFRNFLLYHNIICFGWVMDLFLFSFCVFFLSEKGHFQLKQHDNASFFAFFIKLDLIWPKFCLKSQHFLSVDFQWNLLEDSLILITSVAIQYFSKKMVKPLKIAFWGTICSTNGHHGPCPKWETIFSA